jgi:hypothetical protein
MGRRKWGYLVLGTVILLAIFGLQRFALTENDLGLRIWLWEKIGWPIYSSRGINLLVGWGVLATMVAQWGVWGLLIAITPAFWYMAVFNLPMLILCEVVILLSRNRKILTAIIITGLIIYAGSIFVVQLRGAGARVNERVQSEYKLNNYQDVFPIKLKRIAYNKYYFAAKATWEQIVGYMSWERLAFPGQSDATVTRNLWSSKEMGWIYFWQIPLIVIMVYKLEWLKKMPKWAKIVGIVLGAYSVIITGYHFVAHEEIWHDNRPMVQDAMAKLAVKYQANQVTSILGSTNKYYIWETKNLHPTILFEHFDLTSDQPQVGWIYVGLPGEFLGSKAKGKNNRFDSLELPNNFRLLESVPIRDTVSFGNGDYIWVVKVYEKTPIN